MVIPITTAVAPFHAKDAFCYVAVFRFVKVFGRWFVKSPKYKTGLSGNSIFKKYVYTKKRPSPLHRRGEGLFNFYLLIFDIANLCHAAFVAAAFEVAIKPHVNDV